MSGCNWYFGYVYLEVCDFDWLIVYYCDFIGFEVIECVGGFVFLFFGDYYYDMVLQQVVVMIENGMKFGFYYVVFEVFLEIDLGEVKCWLRYKEVCFDVVDYGVSYVFYI